MVTAAKPYEIHEELWQPSAEAALEGPKRARQAVRIEAYVPALLAERSIALDSGLAQAVYDAQEAITAAQTYADTVGTSTIAQQLLRSEAIASSQIEGIEVPSHRALAKAVAGDQKKPSARAALANIDAVRWVYEWAASDEPFSTEVIRRIHEQLAQADSFLAARAGQIRERQNWIGHDPYTPAEAEFIPPPPRFVRGLLEDLCAYMNRADEPALMQAGLAHAQFETIHPFADGNGRVGRALIGAILVRRGMARNVIPPVSLVLARKPDAYVQALTAWRYDDDGAHRWVRLLAEAAEDAARASTTLAGQVAGLQEKWLKQAGNPRSDSAAAAIIIALPAYPILGAEQAAAITDRSVVAARNALNRLEKAGVLRLVTVGKRNRLWESAGLFALIDEMERQLSAGERGPAPTR